MTTSPTIDASALHRDDPTAALAFVDALLGDASEWSSPLINYRLSSDFQADWKEEVGHWLKTAERCGFLEQLRQRVIKRAKRGTTAVEVDPNDKSHNVLVQELASAMVIHYLTGTGWTFQAWEPITGGSVDVDIQLGAPDGSAVYVQVKAPDLPGRVVGGEYDERIVAAVAKAAQQLPPSGSQVKLIAVCANKGFPISLHPPMSLIADLIGQTTCGSPVTLPKSRLGKFWTSQWAHVAGVVLLDYGRGGDRFLYPCTVLLNPSLDIRGMADWFPHARVCTFDGSEFHWVRGAPGDLHGIPDGARFDPSN
jgi:hypothetical protein